MVAGTAQGIRPLRKVSVGYVFAAHTRAFTKHGGLMGVSGHLGNVLIVDDNADFQLVTSDLAKLYHCSTKQATSLAPMDLS